MSCNHAPGVVCPECPQAVRDTLNSPVTYLTEKSRPVVRTAVNLKQARLHFLLRATWSALDTAMMSEGVCFGFDQSLEEEIKALLKE